MAKRKISAKEASQKYGITAHHEQMENGELRFRLNAEDGSAYVRTEARVTAEKYFGWQNAHFHKRSAETYIVQSGLMILASSIDGETIYEHFTAGQMISTEPYISHNVYLREGTQIHTIKLAEEIGPDWHADPVLDSETKSLSEEEAMKKVQAKPQDDELDPRYASYISVYNNFDNIIWRMPVFLTGGVTLLIGIAVSLLGNKSGGASALVWGSVLATSSLIIFLGAYGLWRIRIHQRMLGDELRKLETDGYFHQRERSRATMLLPRAPAVYMAVFFVLASVLGFASVGVFTGNDRLHKVLKIPAADVEQQ